MSKKALIVYGTRFGATASTSEEIGNALRSEGFDVKIVNAKKEQVSDISGYDLIIVGSGMMIHRWTKEPEKFLMKYQKELAKKKVALFVSSGAQVLIEHDKKFEDFQFGGKTTTITGDEAIGMTRKKYLEEKAAKYSLQPIAMAVFGGVYDYHHMPWWSGKAMEAAKPQLHAAGIKESKPGFYDTRDWNAIRSWAKELAQSV
ncbi:MAG: flavodoxin domain-containing protein [Dehalococcoidales bacterium]|nr:flavodoxin domain-containing protein [Dehalococcoidales bacterium]